ncbi:MULTISPECIES: cytochrome c3 family protein [Ferrimonas]|uniref:cytochrome c3 family protein n=1 Tax=Ferrimonas TaxID=44011 RepID=UPI001FDFBFC0|nr:MULTISPECIES: cytochrome c3 family protein [Ferrimonas]
MMMKHTLITLMLCSLPLAVSAQPIADSHSDMSGCESCHAEGVPSSDMAFENQACLDCHGAMKELGGDAHEKHDGILECTDCHVAHDDVDLNAGCANCHE